MPPEKVTISCRLTPEHHKLLRAAAQYEGLGISTFMVHTSLLQARAIFSDCTSLPHQNATQNPSPTISHQPPKNNTNPAQEDAQNA